MRTEWGSTADQVKAERNENMAKRLADDAYSCPSCRELIVDVSINGAPVAFDVKPGLAEVVGLDNTDRTFLIPAGYSRPKHRCPSIEEYEARMREARTAWVPRLKELLRDGADAPQIQADPLGAAYTAANNRWRAARYGISLEELEERDNRRAPIGFIKTQFPARYGTRDVENLGDGL